MPEDFGFFSKADIEYAFSNMKQNCNWWNKEGNILYSRYLYDHLIALGKIKLEWKAEQLWLQSDSAGLALLALRDKAKAISNDPNITTIPSLLQVEFDAIWQSTWQYSKDAFRQWIYVWSSGLYAKYQALCDLARWLYFNPKVTTLAWGTKTPWVNQRYNDCSLQIAQSTSEILTKQWAIQEVVKNDITQKLQEAYNLDTHLQLSELLEVSQTAKNHFVDVTRKIDQPMQECNTSN